MAIIVGIRFKRMGKTYYFDPEGIELEKGDYAVVETARGVECGEVSIANQDVPEEEIVSPLKKVLRKATQEDIHNAEQNVQKAARAFDICQAKIADHKLDMHLVEVEYAFDGSKIIFYFTADGRVDFRGLVRDLASVFKTRIELRQIGVRDEVKLLGGLGPCGRETCCRSFLTDFAPVSIRMAKDQNLSLNPTKISGLCGRLMCCLGYEQDFYQRTLKRCPKRGMPVKTPAGMGTVDDINILKERVKVRFNINENVEIKEYSLDDIGKDAAQMQEQEARQAAEASEQEAEEVMPDVVFMNGQKAYIEQPEGETRAQSAEPHKDAESQPAQQRRDPNQRRRRPANARVHRPRPEGQGTQGGQRTAPAGEGNGEQRSPGGQQQRAPQGGNAANTNRRPPHRRPEGMNRPPRPEGSRNAGPGGNTGGTNPNGTPNPNAGANSNPNQPNRPRRPRPEGAGGPQAGRNPNRPRRPRPEGAPRPPRNDQNQ